MGVLSRLSPWKGAISGRDNNGSSGSSGGGPVRLSDPSFAGS